MKTLFAFAGIFALLATPSLAQQTGSDAEPPAIPEAAQEEVAAPPSPPTPEEIEMSVKAINELAKDKEKVAAYCDVLDTEDAVKPGDTAAEEAAANKFDAFFASLDDNTQLAFDLDETIDPVSEEGQKLGGAFLKLENQCATRETTDN